MFEQPLPPLTWTSTTSLCYLYCRHLRTDSDSEVLLNVLADEVHRAHQRCLQTTGCDPNKMKVDFMFEAGASTMRLLKGAYSCLCLVAGVGMVGFRDPYGIRPLVLGSRNGPNGEEFCLASEDCAFGPIGFTRVRDVLPGEMVVITQEGKLISKQVHPGKMQPCIFEYIYLARPDSVMNNISVYNFQLDLGSCLAKRIQEEGWDLDLVCPVPDGSRPAAIQIAHDLDIPYREGLVKNRYVGRTFIMPDQRLREMSVRRKLNAMPVVFEGKNVLLVDDSIVRGGCGHHTSLCAPSLNTPLLTPPRPRRIIIRDHNEPDRQHGAAGGGQEGLPGLCLAARQVPQRVRGGHAHAKGVCGKRTQRRAGVGSDVPVWASVVDGNSSRCFP